MRRCPYVPEALHDEGLSFVVRSTKKHMVDNEDDTLLVIVGPPGSGKSMLAMHLVSEFTPSPSAEQFALTQESLARAHDRAVKWFHEGVPDRYVVYDEADVGRRQSLSEWNKDVLSLYMTNRIFGILHVWCWPSLHLLDQAFVQERVNGVFVVLSKERTRPRRYVFFTKSEITKLIEDNVRLTFHNLKKHAPNHAYYLGWFRKYEGPLLEAYRQVKIEAASTISNGFGEKYGQAEKKYSAEKAAKVIGCGRVTMLHALKYALNEGLIGQDAVTIMGDYALTDAHLDVVRGVLINKNHIKHPGGSTK